ncbi:hypothetical protein DINM_003035 [Dirofilaria immitis]|nr:hypothetical protein [Dirofilaria immitis]
MYCFRSKTCKESYPNLNHFGVCLERIQAHTTVVTTTSFTSSPIRPNRVNSTIFLQQKFLMLEVGYDVSFLVKSAQLTIMKISKLPEDIKGIDLTPSDRNSLWKKYDNIMKPKSVVKKQSLLRIHIMMTSSSSPISRYKSHQKSFTVKSNPCTPTIQLPPPTFSGVTKGTFYCKDQHNTALY